MINTHAMSAEQIRHLDEVSDLWQSYGPLLQSKRQLVGGLQWKTVSGKEYLYRYQPDPITKKKRSTSVGRRSPETEALYETFVASRDRLAGNVERIDAILEPQVRVSKALRLNRLDRDVAEVLTTLWEDNLHQHLMAVGSTAVTAYEIQYQRFIAKDQDRRGPSYNFEESAEQMAFIVPDDHEFLAAMLLSLQRIDRTYEFIGSAFTGETGPLVWVYGRDQLVHRLGDLISNDENFDVLEEVIDQPAPAAVAISRAGYPVPLIAAHPAVFGLTDILLGHDEDRAFEIAHLAFGEDVELWQAEDILSAVKGGDAVYAHP